MKHKNDNLFNEKLYGKQKFGFRKLSVGLAAVALGTSFLISNGELVHADAAKNGDQAEIVQDQKQGNQASEHGVNYLSSNKGVSADQQNNDGSVTTEDRVQSSAGDAHTNKKDTNELVKANQTDNQENVEQDVAKTTTLKVERNSESGSLLKQFFKENKEESTTTYKSTVSVDNKNNPTEDMQAGISWKDITIKVDINNAPIGFN
ncbi:MULTISPECIES: YSIRK-type signal peptide-containing protein [Lactobacillus]|uniref:YSIRK-type signal peptide-containing protein n=1 Tax=Lactobacillus xujianguonis TaxID=2495899 RepID=A0A437SVN4_9LACO|nr:MULTISPECIES: YSIRK-type signal peptide-containing protein [Lactobacillus]RVU70986.1 YSIRK-type signal peptide-containing protein [Lactobacillus xujianguonis]RVU73944.1 YSIRK-type signal peptide-containing protein [Lactobacillus xujianguonis]